jgi:hypothetical protein
MYKILYIKLTVRIIQKVKTEFVRFKINV